MSVVKVFDDRGIDREKIPPINPLGSQEKRSTFTSFKHVYKDSAVWCVLYEDTRTGTHETVRHVRHRYPPGTT